jgi:hypothetical protein
VTEPAKRASDDDRERTVDRLREASVSGQLDLEELADRTERAQQARTRGELQELTADLATARERAPITEPQRHKVTFSAHRRRGRWYPAQAASYSNVCGTVELDLRHAVLPGPEIELHIRSWFGTTTILIPPGVEVELTGGGFGATCNVELEGDPGPDAPVVRIRRKGPFGTLNVRNRPRIRDSLRDGVRALQEGLNRRQEP